MAGPPIPSSRRPGRWRILGLALALVVLAAFIYQPWSTTVTAAPPSLKAAEAAGLSDAALVARTSIDLLFHLVAPREDPLAWRSLGEPARHVFILAYADEQLRREGLAELDDRIRRQGTGITRSQIAEAYTAIHLLPVAAILVQAADPATAVLPELSRELAKKDLVEPLAAYIRAHADDILAH